MDKVNISQLEPMVLASTDVALAGGATYTSDIFNVRGYTFLTGFAYSDQNSAANGLAIQQAADINDFTTGFMTQSAITIIGGDSLTNAFNVTIVAPFARIVYTNSAAPQTDFRLFAMARAFGG